MEPGGDGEEEGLGGVTLTEALIKVVRSKRMDWPAISSDPYGFLGIPTKLHSTKIPRWVIRKKTEFDTGQGEQPSKTHTEAVSSAWRS